MRRLRRKAGWTQDQLGDKIGGWSKSTVCIAEKGDRAFTLDDVDRIAAALGRSAADLLALPPCTVCEGSPPAGMDCRVCGTKGAPVPEEGAA